MKQKDRRGLAVLRHVSNGYVAKGLLNSSLPKVKNDDQMAAQFKEGFHLPRSVMLVVGAFEFIGSLFLFMSLFGKKFARIGAILINVVLCGAIFKHLQAGHGVKGSKGALKYFGLNILNFMETFRK
ncbi:MAG TPA: DoxX family protein [Virgibacillus sp.]|nr:DoxX family protein [Virgibacillus sp.]HLR66972.1 DoxX family protein [Virgibacillus sp.]